MSRKSSLSLHQLSLNQLGSVREDIKVKVKVYSVVSSAKRHSPGCTQLPPGHRICSFISHLNSTGSIQPGCHIGARNYLNTQAFTVLPGTHLLLDRENARVCRGPCLWAQCRSMFSVAGDRTRDLSLVRWASYHQNSIPGNFHEHALYNIQSKSDIGLFLDCKF